MIRFFGVLLLCLFIGFFLLGVVDADGRRYYQSERYYQGLWCAAENGRQEVVLSDNSRVDCLTETHAVEIDFAYKWLEAPLQALHYARLTGKRAAVVIICRQPGDERRLAKLLDNINYYKLPVTVKTLYCER